MYEHMNIIYLYIWHKVLFKRLLIFTYISEDMVAWEKFKFYSSKRPALLLLPMFLMSYSCQKDVGAKTDYFKIRVVDSETGHGVPMVGLVPLSRQKYYTDSNGLIAFSEAGLMNERVYFDVKSEGYSYPMG